MARCVGCGFGLPHKSIDDLCVTCLKARDLYESGKLPPTKPQLKLWKVTAQGVKRPGTGGVPIAYIAHTVILAVDKNTAIEKVIENLLDSGALGMDGTEADEIVGPFENGSILAHKEY